jgi:2-dehydropantoate 2-reductase
MMTFVATVAVVGVGSIGTIFAAHLISAGNHKVTCCIRSPLDRLTVEGAYGRLDVSPLCITNPDDTPVADWVLFATKAQDTPSAAPWLRALCGPDTTVVVLQNGVEHEKNLTQFSGPARVLPSVVFSNAKKLGRGHVRHLCPERDLLVPAGTSGVALTELFAGTKLIVESDEDFVSTSWRKFLLNLVANPITAITGRGLEVFQDPAVEHLALGMLREAMEIGRQCGARLDFDAETVLMNWMSRYPGDTGTSMLQDRREGRPLEVDALTGTVVRLGRELGIPTPVNQIICTLLEAMH